MTSNTPDDVDTIVDALRNKFVSMPRDAQLRDAFELFNSHNRKIHEIDRPLQNREAKLLVVTGRSGAGKTTSLTRLLSNHPDFPDYAEQHSIRKDSDSPNQYALWPLLTVTAPSPCVLVELARTVLTPLGYPLARSTQGAAAWAHTRAHLRMKGTRILHIDEMQHATETKNVTQMREIANTIKRLLVDPQWPVSVMISGIEDLNDFLNFDFQLAGRVLQTIRFESISPIDDAREIAAIASDLCSRTRLSLVAPDQDQQFWSRLIHAANCQFGKSVEFFIDTIEHVLKRNSLNGDHRMMMEDFATVYVRKRACRPAANPFIAPDWSLIDTSKILQKAPSRPDDDPSPTSPAKRPRRSKRK
ncbi:MAG: TniB family NTP-binding protein [Methylovirgula sp.]|uniref:TniB family NTP-binding protein n=1 Tax=Methylovirgula sp. TaxID=1978224 RepID=UPI00307657DE